MSWALGESATGPDSASRYCARAWNPLHPHLPGAGARWHRPPAAGTVPPDQQHRHRRQEPYTWLQDHAGYQPASTRALRQPPDWVARSLLHAQVLRHLGAMKTACTAKSDKSKVTYIKPAAN